MLKGIAKPIGSTWTDEQWQAIVARGQDILVSAAAGSGKTAVLVERMIKRITATDDPVDVDRLLIVTFTNASAAEMKKRIGEAIEKELTRQPDSLYLKKQLTLLNRASISTLHSFCMNVLRRYYYKLDLDPKFRIADSTEAEFLRDDVLDELFEEQYSTEDNEAFYNLVDCFSSDRSDMDLQILVSKLYDFSRSHPFPDNWLEKMANCYDGVDGTDGVESELDYSLWTKELLSDIGIQLQGLRSLLEQGLNVTREPSGPAPYAENLDQDIGLINRLIAASRRSWDSAYIAFQQLEFTKLKSCRGDHYDKFLQEKVKGIRDGVKKQVNSMKEDLFTRPIDELYNDIKAMAPLMHMLVALVKQFGQRYTVMKQQKGLVDFSDLEHYCLEILRSPDSMDEHLLLPSEIALDYQKQFEEVLVDEYQDTNLVQESILKLVTRGDTGTGNLFMVGDVKQSIYRFRLSDPGLFLRKYKQFAEEEGLRIDLARNFRSRAEVLDGTNYLFKQIMDEAVGEIQYDEDAHLKLGADYPSSQDMKVELMMIDRATRGEDERTDEGVNDEEPFEHSDEDETIETSSTGGAEQSDRPDSLNAVELETVQLEARLMAQKIKMLIGTDGDNPFYVYDNKHKLLRPIQYRDIVILLRATSSWAPLILEEFKQQGIPSYAELSTGYFDATEITVMMSLLKVIDNPFQDIPLASVLRSPIVGLNEDELAHIRINKRSGALYEALLSSVIDKPEESDETETALSEELLAKLQSFNELLRTWRTRARQGSLSDFIWQIYRETGYFDFVGGLPGGTQRQANLKALYDRARQYEATSFRGLFRFLRFIERMQDRGSDLGTARALGEQEDVVRVMTIHKSKGLEFPVVFIAGLAKMFNMQDLNRKFLLHKELGFGTKFIDTERRISYPTLPQLTIKRRMKMELLAEEMRILYVALTRAKEKLFLIGTVKDGEKKVEQWAQHLDSPEWLLADYERTKARCYLDWIGPAIVRHRDANELFQQIYGAAPPVNHNEISDHPSRWSFSLIESDQLQEVITDKSQLDRVKQDALTHLQPVVGTSEYQSTVNEALTWTYTYSASQEHMAKQSVTELKRHNEWFAEDGSVPSRQSSRSPIADQPRFMQSKKLTAAERGTAMHMVMQHIPLTKSLTIVEIESHIARMVEMELLMNEQAAEINSQGISLFLQSELGQRISKAKEVKREIPFSFGIPAAEVYPDWDENEQETILVQGVIDCLIEEEDGLVLIDYKTDAIIDRYRGGFEEAQPIMIERYQQQLNLYAKAIEQIWKRPLKEKYLYFFDGGHLLRID